MITQATVPDGATLPPHVTEVRRALVEAEAEIATLWQGHGIDGRKVARLLRDALPSWQMERAGSIQALTYQEAGIGPFLVDGQRDRGASIIEIEGGGALQNNRLHRDLLNVLLLDDVEHLVLVVPNAVHHRNPFDYAVSFSRRLLEKQLIPPALTVTVLGYGSAPGN